MQGNALKRQREIDEACRRMETETAYQIRKMDAEIAYRNRKCQIALDKTLEAGGPVAEHLLELMAEFRRQLNG